MENSCEKNQCQTNLLFLNLLLEYISIMMKYTTEIIIDLPRSKVIELFDSTENMYKWQRV